MWINRNNKCYLWVSLSRRLCTYACVVNEKRQRYQRLLSWDFVLTSDIIFFSFSLSFVVVVVYFGFNYIHWKREREKKRVTKAKQPNCIKIHIIWVINAYKCTQQMEIQLKTQLFFIFWPIIICDCHRKSNFVIEISWTIKMSCLNFGLNGKKCHSSDRKIWWQCWAEITTVFTAILNFEQFML